MKKIIILLTAVMLPLLAGAQAQITTKKVKVGDFTEKITKVVLGGNPFYDTILKEEIAARWRISPYEFCSLDEFEEIKGDDQYYFLMLVRGQFRKETAPGLQFLTLVKGGAGSEKGIGEMLEVVSVPFASAEYPSGREFIFLPAFLDIIQMHTLKATEKDFDAYGGLGNRSTNIYRSEDMTIVFSEDDISNTVTDAILQSRFDENIIMTDEDSADEHMENGTANTLVSYVVAPSEPVAGSYCYKMLINSETHELFYFRRHRITKKTGPGFLQNDIVTITAPRRQVSHDNRKS